MIVVRIGPSIGSVAEALPGTSRWGLTVRLRCVSWYLDTLATDHNPGRNRCLDTLARCHRRDVHGDESLTISARRSLQVDYALVISSLRLGS